MLIHRWHDGRPARATDAEEHPESVRAIEVDLHGDGWGGVEAEAGGEVVSLTEREEQQAWRELESNRRAADDDAAMDRAEARAERW